MEKCSCSLCKKEFESDDAALLTVSGVGNKRYLCEDCEAMLNTVLKSRDLDEIADTVVKIGNTMEKSDIEDGVVIREMDNILSAARERAEQIKLGEYDFSLDEEEEVEELSELLEAEPEPELSEEEKERLAKKERISKIVDKISTWVSIGLIAGVVIYFLIRMIF